MRSFLSGRDGGSHSIMDYVAQLQRAEAPSADCDKQKVVNTKSKGRKS